MALSLWSCLGRGLCGLLVAMTACGGDGEGAAEAGADDGKPTVALAFMGPLTGDGANLGMHMLKGAQLAVEMATTTGALPVRLELELFDTQFDPAQARNLTTKVLDDARIIGMVGPLSSGEVKAVAPTLEEAGVPFITPSASNPELARQGWKTFHRVVANDDVQSAEMARYVIHGLHATTRLSVVHDNTEYGRGLAQLTRGALEERGATVGVFDAIDPKGMDYSAVVNKIKAAGSPVVLYAGVYSEAGRLLKQLRDDGVTAVFLSGDGAKDAGIADSAGAAADGARVTCACADPAVQKDPASEAFTAAFTARFGRPPGTYSAETYDSVNLFIAALRQGARTRAAVLKELDVHPNGFQGVTKEISFQSDGEAAAGTVYVYEFRAGQFHLLGTTKELTR